MRHPATLAVRIAVVTIGLATTWSCVSDKVVYRDAASFTQPAAAAASFVGYSRTADKQTTCGNCHVDQQTTWSQTAHSKAWADLQASGHSTSACEACHSVSKLGNGTSKDSVGYVSTKDPRYQDVQCESCHGPGLGHVTAPGLTNRPLASIATDTGKTIANGCGECHTGTHEPFVDEWRGSKHANVEAPAVSNYTKGTNLTCVGCHTAQGALSAWGITTNYREKDSLATHALAVTCSVCHDPHVLQNGKQLRFPIDVADETQNLCMKCHHRRAVPDPTSSSGPHSPEGPTLLGYAGWWPPNLQITAPDTILASHGSTLNPKLCATCHVARFTVTDPKSGSFVFQATGHRFEAIPCLDATGLPTSGPCDISQRTFKACTDSGCHGTEAVARSAMVSVEQETSVLISQLSAMIAKIPATEFSTTDNKYTTGEGAKFNLALAQATGSDIHNPFLIKALLAASIKQIQADYGIAPSPSLVPSLDRIMAKLTKH